VKGWLFWVWLGFFRGKIYEGGFEKFLGRVEAIRPFYVEYCYPDCVDAALFYGVFAFWGWG
jgi:hypothetical protein